MKREQGRENEKEREGERDEKRTRNIWKIEYYRAGNIHNKR